VHVQFVWLQDHQPLPRIVQLPTHKQPSSGHLRGDGGTFGGEWVDHKFCYGVHRCQPEGEVETKLWEPVKKNGERKWDLSVTSFSLKQTLFLIRDYTSASQKNRGDVSVMLMQDNTGILLV